MKIRDKILIQKYYLNVFSGIFMALGLMLLTFGLWLFFDRNNLFTVLFSSGENQLVAYISCMLLGIGSVITFTSAVGFLGSVKEIKCLLVTYMSFQFLVFVTQMAILVLIFMKKEEMECCGRYNVTQWERNKNKENRTQIPCSCIKSSLKKWFCDVPRNSTHSRGCEEFLNTWFENNVMTLTAITNSVLIIQLFLITLSAQLFRNIRKNSIWPKEP
ncbi:tetraspanin-19 isoform X3 [Phalacrocorax aristotelis]|uniref:tetraspanin-19 isoform X3 n=1 Tax=Phalacrocorax aristotelis TaxID=126867 RepID=UPI003F4B119C